MPRKSSEAIARHNAKKREKRRKNRVKLQKSDLPAYKISARRLMPKLPDMTKAQLRDMLAQAMSNTARMV
jgi:predicted HTH transcriptional regulator